MSQSHKLSSDRAFAFILAGNSTVTFKSIPTKQRFTYKIKSAKFNGKLNENLKFVSLMTATDKFSYMGILSKDSYGWNFRRTQKSKVLSSEVSYKAFCWVFNKLQNKVEISEVEIWHEGRCGVCGKTLTVPENISLGIGPQCAKKFKNIYNSNK